MNNTGNFSNNVLETLEYNKIVDMLAKETSTVRGRELASELKPANTSEEVIYRLAETDEALLILNAHPNVTMGAVRDLREILKLAGLGAVLEPHQLLSIADTLSAARRLKTFFGGLPADSEHFQIPILKELAGNIFPLKNIEDDIEQAISPQATVKDNASSALARIRREIKQSQSRIKEKIDNMLRNPDYQKFFQETLVTIRMDRYVIPVKQEYRHNFPGIVHDQSASGATLFIEPMSIVNLNNDLKQLMISEKNEIERILAVISAQIAQVAHAIEENSKILAILDLAFAKAKLAWTMQAIKPVINNIQYIRLICARHPLLKKGHVVPVDIYLGREFQTLLITGSNTGGKTVTLKTVGLFALMTQAGLFIPASTGTTMPVVKNIFADIGDEQSIEQSLSTFSGHMTNIVDILSKVSSGDLVLIDEIGAGTDPDEGAALAMAILEYLHGVGAKTIATTHYSELKTFAFSRFGMENASVEFDLKTLSPTYKLLIGVPGGSNAFAISRRLGLKDSIIEQARELVTKEHANLEAVLTALDEQKRKYNIALSDLEEKEKNLGVRQEKLDKAEMELTRKKNELITKTREEASSVLRQTRREAEEIINLLKEQEKITNSRERQYNIEIARKLLRDGVEKYNNLGGSQENEYDALPNSSENIRPGGKVYVTTLNQKGEVVSINDETATIQLGVMKMNVKLADCRALGKNEQSDTKEQKKYTPEKIKNNANNDIIKFGKTAARKIDIRGLTIEEAQIVLDKYIDEALLSGLAEVLIIHGKGTGALRKGVKFYLDSHPRIKENKIAELNEGGFGATTAKLL